MYKIPPGGGGGSIASSRPTSKTFQQTTFVVFGAFRVTAFMLSPGFVGIFCVTFHVDYMAIISQRERVRERERKSVCVCVYVCVCVRERGMGKLTDMRMCYMFVCV